LGQNPWLIESFFKDIGVGDGRDRAIRDQLDALKKLLENANPTIAEALKVVDAILLLADGALCMDYSGRLKQLHGKCEVTITQKGPCFCMISCILPDGTKAQYDVRPEKDSIELDGVGKMYKISSGKFDIGTISDENIKEAVMSLKRLQYRTENSEEYYFKTYLVEFPNGKKFTVVDNMVHLKQSW
jgi:hypothetical protein